MVSLSALWLPIVVSAVFVFFASFLAWNVLPLHHADWSRLPDEEAVRNALRPQNLHGGQFFFPHAKDNAARKDPEWQRRMKEGPTGMLVLFPPGGGNMGKSMGLHFVHCLLVGLFVAYVSIHALPAGSDYLKVFQVAGTVAILAWTAALPTAAIWFGKSWGSTLREMLDGIVYGLLTAGVFGWLWP